LRTPYLLLFADEFADTLLNETPNRYFDGRNNEGRKKGELSFWSLTRRKVRYV
jgi:hypothetical protein